MKAAAIDIRPIDGRDGQGGGAISRPRDFPPQGGGKLDRPSTAALHDHKTIGARDGRSRYFLRKRCPLTDRLSIRRSGNVEENLYCKLLDNAFNQALALEGKVSWRVQSMDGMSGRNYRLMINNLVESLPDPRYLEVGSWAGSTACSAMEGNRATVVCIDNWSLFGGPKEEFLANTAACISDRMSFTFIENDFRQVDYSGIGKFNIYLFDGPHSKQDQYDGVTFALPALDDQFVFIVDDWNWQGVRDGTHEAIAASGLRVLFSIEVRTTQDDSHAEAARQYSDWHNGYFLSVLSK